MADRIAVVTDSSCSLTSDEIYADELQVVEIAVLADRQELRTLEELHQAFSTEKKISTAAPGISVFENIFEGLFARGFTHVFSIHMSSKLSSTYEHALAASQRFTGKVQVFDSRTAGFAQGQLVLEVLRMIERGSGRYEINHFIENYFPDEVILLPRSMESLKQGGRIKSSAAMIAQLFQIIPWGKIEDGKLLYAGRARSFESALETIVHQNIIQKNWDRKVVVQADQLVNELATSEQLCNLRQKHQIRPIPAVLLAHTGPGAIALILER